MATQLGLVLYLAPWVALALPPLLVAYARIYHRMRAAARDSRRIASMAHTPVFEHYADALSGRETIAAYSAHERFCVQNAARVSSLSRAGVMTEAVQKWAQALATQAGCVLYFVAGLVCVLLHAYASLTTSQLGLVLLYAGTLQRATMDLMMRLTAIEMEFVSVERIADFLRLDSEEESDSSSSSPTTGSVAPLVAPSRQAATSTTAHPHTANDRGAARGVLELRCVVIRYVPSRPPALRGLTLSIDGGERVVLCGRTGCGKTSVLRALPRLYPLESGTITLDGVDTATWPLAQLRVAVRLLAQEPLLVRGTLLANLTAFATLDAAPPPPSHPTAGGLRHEQLAPPAEAAEQHAWQVLTAIGLSERLAALPLGLHTPVEAAGLSEGERQLLSLCRALVAHGGAKTMRVLLCDEPTSNIDLGSDDKVMDALMGLRNVTVLVSAHRLQHLRRFDRAVVMDRGVVAEAGAPDAYSVPGLLADASLRLPLTIALVLSIGQQWSGINAVFFYSTGFFQAAGLSNPALGSLLASGVNLLAMVLAVPLMESVGRKKLLLLGTQGMLGAGVLLCSVLAAKAASLTLLPAPLLNGLSVLAILAFVSAFEVGPGPIPWQIGGEIFPEAPRASAMSLAATVNWLCNAAIGLSFPVMQRALGPLAFLPFCAVLFAWTQFTRRYVPETKGKSVGEVGEELAAIAAGGKPLD